MSVVKIQEGDTIEIFVDDIDQAITMFCEEQNIDSIKDCSQSVWNGCLMYIYNNCFKNTDRLKSRDMFPVGKNGFSNFNSYNWELVYDLAIYYIYLCCIYEKECSIVGFSRLTGIHIQSIYNSGSGVVVSSSSFDIAKTIQEANEESLANVLYTGRKNPVGIIAILNHRHNWQTAAAARGEQKPVLTADQLPNLSAIDGQKREFLPNTATSGEKATNDG